MNWRQNPEYVSQVFNKNTRIPVVVGRLLQQEAARDKRRIEDPDKALAVFDKALKKREDKTGKAVDVGFVKGQIKKLYSMLFSRDTYSQPAAPAAAAPAAPVEAPVKIEEMDRVTPVEVKDQRGRAVQGPSTTATARAEGFEDTQSALKALQRNIIELSLQARRTTRNNPRRPVWRIRINPLNDRDANPLLTYLSRIQRGERLDPRDHLRAAHLLMAHADDRNMDTKELRGILKNVENYAATQGVNAAKWNDRKTTPDPDDYLILDPHVGSRTLGRSYQGSALTKEDQKNLTLEPKHERKFHGKTGRLAWKWTPGQSFFSLYTPTNFQLVLGGEVKSLSSFLTEGELSLRAKHPDEFIETKIVLNGTVSYRVSSLSLRLTPYIVDALRESGATEFASRLEEAYRQWPNALKEASTGYALQPHEVQQITPFLTRINAAAQKAVLGEKEEGRFIVSKISDEIRVLAEEAQRDTSRAAEIRSLINVIDGVQSKGEPMLLTPDDSIAIRRFITVYTPGSSPALVQPGSSSFSTGKDGKTKARQGAFILYIPDLTTKQLMWVLKYVRQGKQGLSSLGRFMGVVNRNWGIERTNAYIRENWMKGGKKGLLFPVGTALEGYREVTLDGLYFPANTVVEDIAKKQASEKGRGVSGFSHEAAKWKLTITPELLGFGSDWGVIHPKKGKYRYRYVPYYKFPSKDPAIMLALAQLFALMPADSSLCESGRVNTDLPAFPYLALSAAILRGVGAVGLWLDQEDADAAQIEVDYKAERTYLTNNGYRLKDARVPSVSSGQVAEVPGLRRRVTEENSPFHGTPYAELVVRLSPRPTFQHVYKGFKPLPYQRIGIAFAQLTGLRCIIGDEMGLGKTIQGLGCLAMDPSPITGKNMFPACIICPASTMTNWVDEIKSWLPNKTVAMIKAGEANFTDDEGRQRNDPDVAVMSWGAVGSAGLTFQGNYQTLIVDEAHYGKRLYGRSSVVAPSVADIARGKSTKSKRTGGKYTQRTMGMVMLAHSAEHCIFLSGTPVENADEDEFWSLLHCIDPVRWPGLNAFKNELSERSRKLAAAGIEGNAGELRAQVFRNIAKLFMIRRLKSDVAEQLGRPPSLTGPGLGCLKVPNGKLQLPPLRPDAGCPGGPGCEPEDAARAELDTNAKDIVPEFTAGGKEGSKPEVYIKVGPSKCIFFKQVYGPEGSPEHEAMEIYREASSNLGSLIAGTEKRRRAIGIAEAWASAALGQSSDGDSMSSIADAVARVNTARRDYDAGSVAEVPLAVYHYLLTTIGKIKIPFALGMAKRTLKAQRTAGYFPAVTAQDPASAVVGVLPERRNAQKPLILWARMLETVAALKEAFEATEYRTAVIDGSTPTTERGVIVKKFQNGLLDVVIATKAMREGVTMTAANRAIFVEYWYVPAWMAQAEDRIYRIGQNQDCEVTYLTAPDTIDEKMEKMRRKKKYITSALIGDEPYVETTSDIKRLEDREAENMLGITAEDVKDVAQTNPKDVKVSVADVMEILAELNLTRTTLELTNAGANYKTMGYLSIDPRVAEGKRLDGVRFAAAMEPLIKRMWQTSTDSDLRGRRFTDRLKLMLKLAWNLSRQGTKPVAWVSLFDAMKKIGKTSSYPTLLGYFSAVKDLKVTSTEGEKPFDVFTVEMPDVEGIEISRSNQRAVIAVMQYLEKNHNLKEFAYNAKQKLVDDGSGLSTEGVAGRYNEVSSYFSKMKKAFKGPDAPWWTTMQTLSMKPQDIERYKAAGLIRENTQPIQDYRPVPGVRTFEKPSGAGIIANKGQYMRAGRAMERVNPSRIKRTMKRLGVQVRLDESMRQAAEMMRSAQEGNLIHAYGLFGYLTETQRMAQEAGLRMDSRVVDALRRIQPWLQSRLG